MDLALTSESLAVGALLCFGNPLTLKVASKATTMNVTSQGFRYLEVVAASTADRFS